MPDPASSSRNTSILLSSHVRLGTWQVFHPPVTELGLNDEQARRYIRNDDWRQLANPAHYQPVTANERASTTGRFAVAEARLFLHPELHARQSAAARRHVADQFSFEAFIAGHRKLYGLI